MSSFTTSLICTALLASAASAASAREVHFTQDGYEYSAEVTELADGSMYIKGRERVTGKTFKFNVKDAKVRGFYGSTRIAFAQPQGEVSQLGSR